MKQNHLKPYAGSTHREKRLGRGKSRGNYSGRGMKGQGSRTGSKSRISFEGGQTPLIRRMPKMKGFKNFNKESYHAVNLHQLSVFKEGETVDAQALREKRVVTRKGKIKLLGSGELAMKLSIVVDRASETALAKVKKAGGELKLLEAARSSKETE